MGRVGGDARGVLGSAHLLAKFRRRLLRLRRRRRRVSFRLRERRAKFRRLRAVRRRRLGGGVLGGGERGGESRRLRRLVLRRLKRRVFQRRLVSLGRLRRRIFPRRLSRERRLRGETFHLANGVVARDAKRLEFHARRFHLRLVFARRLLACRLGAFECRRGVGFGGGERFAKATDGILERRDARLLLRLRLLRLRRRLRFDRLELGGESPRRIFRASDVVAKSRDFRVPLPRLLRARLEIASSRFGVAFRGGARLRERRLETSDRLVRVSRVVACARRRGFHRRRHLRARVVEFGGESRGVRDGGVARRGERSRAIGSRRRLGSRRLVRLHETLVRLRETLVRVHETRHQRGNVRLSLGEERVDAALLLCRFLRRFLRRRVRRERVEIFFEGREFRLEGRGACLGVVAFGANRVDGSHRRLQLAVFIGERRLQFFEFRVGDGARGVCGVANRRRLRVQSHRFGASGVQRRLETRNLLGSLRGRRLDRDNLVSQRSRAFLGVVAFGANRVDVGFRGGEFRAETSGRLLRLGHLLFRLGDRLRETRRLARAFPRLRLERCFR